MMIRRGLIGLIVAVLVPAAGVAAGADDWWKPYSPPCTEREDVFAFTEKPAVTFVGRDKYEITFAVKGNCDVTVGIVDPREDLTGLGRGTVVRHLGSGVLGPNAPEPFQKNSLKQKIYWNGKDDLGRYPKEPEKFRVRVMLGLKPVFDKNLGGTSPYDMPGHISAIGVDKEGVYVFSRGGHGLPFMRKFDHNMQYLASLTSPPANLPESKLKGMGYIEYEPGKKALQSANFHDYAGDRGVYLPGSYATTCRPAVVNGRVYYLNKGLHVPSYLYYIYTDGSTDLAGCVDRPFAPDKFMHPDPRLAASPDGKWIYMANLSARGKAGHALLRCATGNAEPAKAFIGTMGTPGSDNASLNGPCGVDCDSEGRIYVCDRSNMRVQVFSPEGTHLKTLAVESPEWVWVHQKTGAVYVMHQSRVKGETITRLTKHSAFPEMKKLFHFDGIVCTVAALDSWSDSPRLLTGGGVMPGKRDARIMDSHYNVRVWEEKDNSFRVVLDFQEEAMKHAGANYVGRWNGDHGKNNKIACDPVREQVYLALSPNSAFRFDLPSGRLIERVTYEGAYDDIAFDKHGYMHAHFNPSAYQMGVGRFDPNQAMAASQSPDYLKVRSVRLKEVPYDYGVIPSRSWSGLGDGEYRFGGSRKKLAGVLDVKDQGGGKYFQEGLGVNMQGDVAEECNIYYVPRMEDVGRDIFEGSSVTKQYRRHSPSPEGLPTYQKFLREISALQKKGKDTFFIPRAPGVFLSPATIWTFDRTGELRDKLAVVAGNLINGVQIDEDGKLYFTVNRQRLSDRKVFLAGRAGVIGGTSVIHPFTGTYIKSRAKEVRLLAERSPYVAVQLEQKPDRPLEVGGYPGRNGEPGEFCWVQGAEWLYAGASPVVTQHPCSCPTLRSGLDWYKRSYVPEGYRHSIGVLDTNGNLILHMGRYGNRDSADGVKSRIRVGGDNIAVSYCEYVSTTDNYMCYGDLGARLAVIRLDYHAEETVPIPVP